MGYNDAFYYKGSLNQELYYYADCNPSKRSVENVWEKARDYCAKTGVPCIWCTYKDCENRIYRDDIAALYK